MSSSLILSIAFIFVYSLLQTLSCVLLCYSEPEHCVSLAKQVHVGLVVLDTPGWTTHAGT